MSQDLAINASPTAQTDIDDAPRPTGSATPAEEHAETPPVLDTYALLYALCLVFLVPGAISIGDLAFRTYSFAYVSLVTVPFVLGLLAVLLTDSCDSLKTVLVRAAILVPIILLTGVTVLFTASIIVLPISQVLTPKGFDIAGPVATLSLIGLALPLVPALFRRFSLPLGWRSVVQVLALLFAIAVVIGVVMLTLRPDRTLATIQRKDVMIYIVGALVWYLPSFGISAGVWRRVGLI